MSYRPQFVFSTPRGFRDESFHYSFDSTNTPGLGVSIASGAFLNNIVLQTQADAEFICRALKVQLGTAASNLNLTIKNPQGLYLSAVNVPIADYLTPSGLAVVGSLFVPFEPEVRIPPSGFFEVYLENLTGGSLACPAFTFYGLKRYRVEDVAA